jgi:hypothetical protein
VRETGRQLADASQAVRATQPVLELADARQVSEDADDAELLAFVTAQRRHAELHGQAAAVAAVQREGSRGSGHVVGQRLHQQLGQLRRVREDLGGVPAGHFAGEEAGHDLRRRIECHHAALEIDGHDAARQRGEDVIGVALQIGQLLETAAELGVDVLQRGALTRQLRGHVVEGRRQAPDLVVRGRLDALVQLAARDGDGTVGQLLDRA